MIQRKPSDFKSPEDFRRSLEALIQKQAATCQRDLQRFRREVAFERLLARLFSAADSPFILKGGCAMELRMEVARATRDIDLVILEEASERAALLHETLAYYATRDLEDGFDFTVQKMKFALTTTLKGGARFPVMCRIGRRPFINFTIDVALGEPVILPIEWEEIPGKLSWYQLPNFRCRMISREQQFAEKIHAYATTGEGNSRVKDLVDLYLLIGEKRMDADRVKGSIHHVFGLRTTHLPPTLLANPPEAWAKRFAPLASEAGLECSIEAAYERVADYYAILNV